MDKTLSLKEIAEILKVSPSTISLVLHGKTGVSRATREKVMEQLKEHGYLGEYEQLNKKEIRVLKFVDNTILLDRNDGFVTSIIDSCEVEARKRGYDFAMIPCKEDDLDNLSGLSSGKIISGLLFIATELSENLYGKLRNVDIPVVAIDNSMNYEQIDSVSINNKAVVYEAVKFLYEMGNDEIGYLRSSTLFSNYKERNDGYHRALKKFGLVDEVKNVYSIEPTMEGAYKAMTLLLKQGKGLPKALFADNDMIAIGCIKAIRESGYQVPEEISVIGVDDIPFAKMVDPPITTMRISAEYMGRTAVELLDKRIANPQNPFSKVRINGELIRRKSTFNRKESGKDR